MYHESEPRLGGLPLGTLSTVYIQILNTYLLEFLIASRLTGLLILFKKGSSVPFMYHDPSKLDHKRPDPDHPKAQGPSR